MSGYRGKPPADGVLLDELEVGGRRWAVYRRPSPSMSWQRVKVCVIGKIVCKANYHLGWNGERLALCKEAKALLEHRPALHAAVVNLLSESGL